jgi:hypothetical protein
MNFFIPTCAAGSAILIIYIYHHHHHHHLPPPWIWSFDLFRHRPGTKNEKRFGIHETLNIAAWNARSMGNKESELIEEIKAKGTNIFN